MMAIKTKAIELRVAGLRNCAIATQLRITQGYVSQLLKNCAVPMPVKLHVTEIRLRNLKSTTAGASASSARPRALYLVHDGRTIRIAPRPEVGERVIVRIGEKARAAA